MLWPCPNVLYPQSSLPPEGNKMDLYLGLLPYHEEPQVSVPIDHVLVQKYPVKVPTQLCNNHPENEVSHGTAEAIPRPGTKRPESLSVISVKCLVVLGMTRWKPSLRFKFVWFVEIPWGVSCCISAC
jgi:hypothetical protein